MLSLNIYIHFLSSSTASDGFCSESTSKAFSNSCFRSFGAASIKGYAAPSSIVYYSPEPITAIPFIASKSRGRSSPTNFAANCAFDVLSFPHTKFTLGLTDVDVFAAIAFKISSGYYIDVVHFNVTLLTNGKN